MPTNHRKLKLLTFTLGGSTFQCQIQNWQLLNNTEDGERFYTFCGPDETGEFREDAEPDWALQFNGFADWRSAGLSTYLQENDQATVGFQIDHHVGVVGEHVRWTGEVKLKATGAGGDARTTERFESTLPCIGKPEFTRV